MIGVDIIKISRISSMRNLDQFVHRVLSENEINSYQTMHADSRKIEWLAGRFAAKEAIIKALPLENITLKDIEIQTKNNKSFAVVQNYHLDVSISHEEDVAVAVAIISSHDSERE